MSSTASTEKILDLKCESCLQSYDRVENIPKLLPMCFHPLCFKCINSIISSQGIFTCPFCQKPYMNGFRNADDFPINTYIMNTMYAPQKKRKLNDGTANASFPFPIVKKEEVYEQEPIQQQRNLKEEEEITVINNISNHPQPKVEQIEQKEPKVLQKLKSKYSRLHDEYSYNTSNNSSRSLMVSTGSKYIYRTKEALENLNQKRKFSSLNESSINHQNKCQGYSKHSSEDSNSKSTHRSMINATSSQNSRNFINYNASQFKSSILKPTKTIHIGDNNEQISKSQEIRQGKQSVSSAQCQESRGLHSLELKLQDQQQPINSNFQIQVKQENITKPKIQLSAQQLQQQLIPYFNKGFNEFFISSASSENSQDVHLVNYDDTQKCDQHDEVYTYFCESHKQPFCFKCHQHSFCENINLIEHLRLQKQKEIRKIINDERNSVDLLFNLLSHYQNIDKEIYRFETSQVASIEKTFSELISNLLKKKENMIKDLSSTSKKLHQDLSQKLECIQDSIQKCQEINQQTTQLQQLSKSNIFSTINNELNFNKIPENVNKCLSFSEITKAIDEQQTNLLYTLQQFQEQYNSIKIKQSLFSPIRQTTPLHSQSTTQTSNESSNNYQPKNKCIASMADFSNYIEMQITDKYEAQETYLQKLPQFRLNPDKIIQQHLNSTLIQSY